MPIKSLFFCWFLACLALVLVSCTLTEWGQIGEDAVEIAPDAVNKILENPSPVGIIIVLASFISGLVAKSAARGFGKGAKITSSKAYEVAKKVVDALSTKSEPPPEKPAE